MSSWLQLSQLFVIKPEKFKADMDLSNSYVSLFLIVERT